VERCDVAVVGLGALGSATAYQLARRGLSVVGLEQFELGHVRGASHDTSRILRRTYHVPHYVRLADAAYRDWEDLERAAQERFVTTTGGVTLCTPESSIRADHYARSLSDQDVPFEILEARQLASRYPQFRVADDVLAVVQDDSAVVPAGRSTAVLQMLARAHGATIRGECPVSAIEPGTDAVTLFTAGGLVTASKVVVCADAWTNKLLAPLGAALPLVSTLEQVSYFAPEDPSRFAPGAFPVWIWADEPCYYGFPTYGEPSIKAARDNSGISFAVEDRSFEPVPQRLQELIEFMHALVPAKGRHLRTVTCQYTLTPDRDFVLGPLGDHPDVLVALGAGHAFKFTPTIGRVMADLAMTGTTDEDLSAFSPDRFLSDGPAGATAPHTPVSATLAAPTELGSL
jgi:sarcosine oxidase